MNWNLVYGSNTQLCCKDIRTDWFNAALEHLKQGNVAEWVVLLKGAGDENKRIDWPRS
jgi:hypothetical protein